MEPNNAAETSTGHDSKPPPGKLYKEPARSLAVQALARGEAPPTPGLTAGQLRAQGYTIDLEDADDAAVLTVDVNSPTGFVWQPPAPPPEFALAV